jgi:O-antigen/teichoic acid export membrane protein
LTDAALILPNALAAFVLPHLSKNHTAKKYKQTVWQILLFAFAITALAALPMLVFPETIIHILFGTAFAPAADCLPILALGMISAGMVIVANPIMASRRQEKRLMINSGILAACMALLTYMFRNDLTALNAAYIFSISYTIGMLISVCNAIRSWKLEEAAP